MESQEDRLLSSPRKPLCVILDSNFLLIPFEFKVDIFSELQNLLQRRVEFLLLKPIYEEMMRLRTEGNAKLRKRASSALELCRDKCRITELQSLNGETTDELLIRAAQNLRCLVATNDKDLRLRLREKGIPVVYLRQKSFLKIDGWI